jgi:hypothetical protein
MKTLEKIAIHAAEIMANGGPKNTWERNVVDMATPKGNAGNAGKRTKKNHNKNW